MAELNLKQITDKLNTEFTGEVRKLVFWYDANADFADDVDALELVNARVLHLEPDNQFYTKYFLECVDTTTNYLIYAPFAKPDIRENHLADTIRYSKEFFADRASLLTLDLGMDERYKPVIQHYIKFFGDKKRTQAFYDLELETFNQTTIEVALMSVLCKCKIPSFEEVLRIVWMHGKSRGTGRMQESDESMEHTERMQESDESMEHTERMQESDESMEHMERMREQDDSARRTDGFFGHNSYLAEFEKYDLLEAFWRQVQDMFGYADEAPTLEKLAMTMFVTYAARTVTADLPAAWAPFVSFKSGNIIAFLDNLMNSYLYGERFDEISGMVYESLKADTELKKLPLESLTSCGIFAGIEELLIQWVTERLEMEDVAAKSGELTIPQLIARRRQGHFGKQYLSEYLVLENAWHLISTARYSSSSNLDELVKNYTGSLYKTDRYYRYFYYYLDRVNLSENMGVYAGENADIYAGENAGIYASGNVSAYAGMAKREGRPGSSVPDAARFDRLRELVENIYANEYLSKVCANWTELFDAEADTLQILKQPEFFRRCVNYSKEQLVVILSDALRYETGVSLFEKLQADAKCKAAIKPMVSVLPSITKYGMAAMLPHKTLELTDSYGILVDGRSADTTQQRQAILQTYKSAARCVRYDDIKSMSVAELRGIFTRQDVVYIYHNQIDARGDAAHTENEVFDACAEAVDEIAALIRRLTTSANRSHFIVTADHGFLYRRDKLAESDKVDLSAAKMIEPYNADLTASKLIEPYNADLSASKLIEPYNADLRTEKRIERDKVDVSAWQREGSGDGETSFSTEQSEVIGRRYVLSDRAMAAEGVASVPLGAMFQNQDGRMVSYPKGADIFKTPGAGMNYVHGGCSPQEMLVPLIDVKTEKGYRETTTAQIALVSLTTKITNLITSLDFVQTEAVSDVVKETTYRIYFIDDNGEKISNEHLYVADKKDPETVKRVFRLRFSFKNKKYGGRQKYYLVAYDDHSSLEVLRHEVVMDIAFADDFGF